MRKTTKNYRMLLVISAAVLLVILTAACTNEGEDESANTSVSENNEEASEEPMEIEIMTVFNRSDPPPEDNKVLDKVEEYTNTKLDVTFVPGSTYSDRFNVTMASGQLPHAILAMDLKSPTIVNAARSGMFWEIGPLLDEYENLSQYYNPQVMDNTKVDGKIYSLYRTRAVTRRGLVYREDWVENLNLSMPKTLDELYEFFRALTEDDPDGNGEDDTYGFGLPSNLTGMLRYLTTQLGGPNVWKVENGEFIPMFETEPYDEALDFVRRLYEDKLVNQDFAASQGGQHLQNLYQGINGSIMDAMNFTGRTREAELQQSEPEGRLNIFPKLEDEPGTVFAEAGFYGAFFFPKSRIETEEELKKVLAYFDKILDPEIANLLSYGFEGEHYEVTDEGVVILEEFRNEYHDTNAISFGSSVFSLPLAELHPVDKQAIQYENELAAEAIHDPTMPLISDTFTEVAGELNQIINDAQTKYVMGVIDRAEFDEALVEWRNAGGNKVIEEYNQAYAQINN